MACLNMQQVKNDQKQVGGGGFMGPRISFSNDFIDANLLHENMSYTEAPVSSDFEFSVPTLSSNSADEVFFKGRFPPPLKEKVVTLRDELLSGHHDDDDDTNTNNKNSSSHGWWKDKFGLRKTQNGHKNLGGLETIDEAKIKPSFQTHHFTGGSNRYK